MRRAALVAELLEERDEPIHDAVERVASALAERDTLTAAEIAEILSRNDEAPRPAVSESS
jgi:hypothetical protein